jgi:crotonobetainyl-CoA:carnitine CoA-transferase CaiB-like acyl-CoA transferase
MEACPPELRGTLSGLTRDEAVARLEALQIAWSRVSTVRDLAAHPALRRVDVPLPNGETIGVPRPAGRSRLDAGIVPALGQHTAAIRAEFRGDAS